MKNIHATLRIACLFVLLSLLACDYEYELPEANSKADETPPTASFSASETDDFLTWNFGNASSNATNYQWDFGDGNTSTDVDGSNTYPDEGMYTVTLVASDALGQSDTYTMEITVEEPEAPPVIIPEILEASFEDNSPNSGGCGDGNMDGRDCWRNSALGGVIQITSSPVRTGSQASKYPSAGDRIAYQELSVSQNVDYNLSFWYTLKTNNPGSITVDVLAGGGHTDVSGATILGTFTGTDQTSSSTYTPGNVSFNTGTNDVVSIYVHNQGEEARIDDFAIDAP